MPKGSAQAKASSVILSVRPGASDKCMSTEKEANRDPNWHHPGQRSVQPHLYAEWNNKAVGFVSDGSAGGARTVEHFRR